MTEVFDALHHKGSGDMEIDTRLAGPRLSWERRGVDITARLRSHVDEALVA